MGALGLLSWQGQLFRLEIQLRSAFGCPNDFLSSNVKGSEAVYILLIVKNIQAVPL